MAINRPGAMFASKGIQYVLKYGPKGNLRPYTLGPIAVKAAMKTRNPYLIAGVIVAVAIGFGGWWAYSKFKED